jgi:hypothetical protein
MNKQYSSIAIFDVVADSKVAISAISVTPNEVVLSGAWVFSQSNKKDISLVLSDRLGIPLSLEAENLLTEKEFGYKKVSMSDFFSEAQSDAKLGLQAFNEFKEQDLKKRKNLVEPSFFDWKDVPNLLQSASVLNSLGLTDQYEGTATEMRSVLAAARLVQFYILKWHADESSRTGRKYVEGSDAEITILPRSWMI